MRDLWRMDNERGYWITESCSFVILLGRSIHCSEEKPEREKNRKKHNRNIIQLAGAKRLSSAARTEPKMLKRFDKFHSNCPLKDSVNYEQNCRFSSRCTIRT